MTTEELEKIVARHEMQCLELKESFNVECIETACAFTNAQGGFIVIGVDNDGNPSKRQLRFEGLRDYENKISTATEPSVAVDAEKLEFGGRDVIEQYGSGIRRINSDCDMNGSPYPVLKSENGEFIIKFLARTKESASKIGIDPAKFGVSDKTNVATSLKTGPKTGPKGRYKILELLREHPKITISDLMEETRLSRNGVKWNIGKLKAEGLVRRVGPAKGGYWVVVEP